MIYCDTSLLVAGLTREARTPAVQNWMRTRGTGELCISPWTVTEFSSAISLKVRHGSLPADAKGAVLTQWRAMQVDQLVMVPVQEESFNLASRFCETNVSGLRAGDALHLAVASLSGHSLATLDAVMAGAALAVGVRVVGV